MKDRPTSVRLIDVALIIVGLGFAAGAKPARQ